MPKQPDDTLDQHELKQMWADLAQLREIVKLQGLRIGMLERAAARQGFRAPAGGDEAGNGPNGE